MRQWSVRFRPSRPVAGGPAAGRGDPLARVRPGRLPAAVRGLLGHPGRGRVWAAAIAVVASCAAVASPLAAQTGTVSGRITDAGTGEPLARAQVVVVGTELGALADVEGAFRITDVPATAGEVRVTTIGYQDATVPFEVEAGGTVVVDISMSESAIALDAVVVTGTAGDTRRRAIGNAVSTVDASDVLARSSVNDVTDLLQAKAPGLTLIPGSGTAGTAANFRLRGASSINGGTSPVIYLDGVRINNGSQGNYTVFGQSTSALDAINPRDIASVEVIKGPAAATLYGAEAAGGVIQIITKRGASGPMRWSAYAETGASDWTEGLRPTNHAVATPERIADSESWPGFQGLQPGDVVSHKVLSDRGALRTGVLSKFSLSARGGGDRYSFFLSAGRDTEDGVYRNNFARRTSLRGNFNFVPSDIFDVSIDVAYSNNHVRLPLNDNIAFGLIISSYLATPGRQYPYPAGENYFTILPEVANTYDNQTRADRTILGTTLNFRPFDWFTNRLQVGLDLNTGRAELYFPPQPEGLDPFSARASFELDNTKGFIAQGRPLTRDITVDYAGGVSRSLSEDLQSTLSFGMQYLANEYRRTDAFGQDLGAKGVRLVSAAAVRTSRAEFSEQKSVGFYLQEQLGWRDRLFATAALRMDNNSAFGEEIRRALYPKASLSYVISEEPFFDLPAIDELRLRFAWGQAGNSPGPFDAIRTYGSSVVTLRDGTSASALRYSSVGNPNLEPERGSEFELGFDATLWDGRLALDATFYSSRTRDALLPVPVPASTGFTGSRLENLGEISNRGVELLLTAASVRRPSFALEHSLSLSTNRNELVSFGDERENITFGAYAPVQRYQEGHPLGALWASRVARDAEGNVVKDADGRPVLEADQVYKGPSVPPREATFSTTITMWERLRVFGLVDYKGGHYQFNVKDWRRDRAGVSWETVNPDADPDEVLVRQFAAQTDLHIQPADFIKLRDVTLSYTLPRRLLDRIGVGNATLSVTGHNLAIWTRYGGADPEVNFHGPATFNQVDSWTLPMVRRFAASLAFDF